MNQQTVPDGFSRWIQLSHIRQPPQEAQIAVLWELVSHELEKRFLIGRLARPRLTDAQESFACCCQVGIGTLRSLDIIPACAHQGQNVGNNCACQGLTM